ncbi:MAG: glycosyltransferase family 2 protein [Eubacteriales bacterium]|nr:glycosyltransferase family 2 protein [Eubacteriales bacterium]
MLPNINTIIYHVTQVLQVTIFTAGCYFFSISVFGWFRRKKRNASDAVPKKSFAIVVAAHNEEAVIKHVVDSLKELDYPKNLYDIFVIADNCTDSTAEISSGCGAIVYERTDLTKRGKGYALDWMFSKLFSMEKRYDAVCVFDADNLVCSRFLIEMNNKLCKGYKAIQGYIDSKNPFDSWISCSYSIAFWLANRTFQLPRYNLGLSCSLCGTGFCVDMDLLKEVGWGTTSLTEDLEFTMKLALNNYKVVWAHNAVVYDEKPLTLKQSWRQRKRWMQGHADCAQKYLPPLFKKAFAESNLLAFDCGIYLFQPIRFILVGMLSMMMWIQTIFPESPFFSMQYVFPTYMWYILVFFQFIYGPLVVLAEKKFQKKIVLGFLIYPLYCLTWVPIAIQGIASRKNKSWTHTLHTRGISLKELNKI